MYMTKRMVLVTVFGVYALYTPACTKMTRNEGFGVRCMVRDMGRLRLVLG